MLVESVPRGIRFVVVHSREDNPQLPALQEMLRARLGDGLELRIVSLGPVLSIHLGLTYLGVCWMNEADEAQKNEA
jgi:fatty acid-binding protein DegV